MFTALRKTFKNNHILSLECISEGEVDIFYNKYYNPIRNINTTTVLEQYKL